MEMLIQAIKWNSWQTVLIGGFCSLFIAPAAFNASLIDALLAFPMGAFLVFAQVQVASRSDVLSSMFEIIIAAVVSFIAAAVASTGLFCYAAVTSASIVLILPGWLVCCAALELQSRSIVVGSVRLVWVSPFPFLP